MLSQGQRSVWEHRDWAFSSYGTRVCLQHPQSLCSTLTLEMLVVYNLDYMVGMVATAGIVLDVYVAGQKCVYFVGQFHCPGGLWRIRSSPLLSVATPTISLPTPGYCLNRELTIKRLESGHGEESCLLDAKLILCPM